MESLCREHGDTRCVSRRRLKFSPEKDAAIIVFVAEHRHQDLKPTAPKFWAATAPLLPPLLVGHTPTSIHTHFIKQVRLAACQTGRCGVVWWGRQLNRSVNTTGHRLTNLASLLDRAV